MAEVAKGPDAFRTISETSTEVGVPQHVLRFWETRFAFVKPMKRAGGRRYYRPQDVAVLRGVRALLQQDGYTIRGVQRLHREEGVRRLVAAGRGERPPPPRPEDAKEVPPGSLEAVIEGLVAAKARLDTVLARGSH